MGRLSHTRSGQGRAEMTERQKWVTHKFEFLKQHITSEYSRKHSQDYGTT